MDKKINDFVIRFANVNGTGSASANNIVAKTIFRMGIPVSPKNIFPSNIQGLPTWFELRVSEDGYLGRRMGINILVGVNPQSLKKDIESVAEGGFFIYDSSKKMREENFRPDIHFIGVPMIKLCIEHYYDARQQQLFKNIVYVGALAALIDLDMDILKGIIAEQFERKPKLIPPNYQALDLGFNYVKAHFDCPLPYQLKKSNKVGDAILVDGNSSIALGAIYAGATIAAWYPITPSTSTVKAFETYAKKLRVDKKSGKNNYAILQAEDELAAIGMVIGASWNGARAFTATSGAGVSLMSEFIGLAYFAEIPVVLINVQRGGPSTGMPTRTQQADIISSMYASHGDTKHVLLWPCSPAECFEMTALAFDLAEKLQTVVFVMSDLDLGMNFHMSPPFKWDKDRTYDRGKILRTEDLEGIKEFGRYLDVDGDGIPYRTIPGTHPTKGAFFTRGTSKNEYAQYREDGESYIRNVDRLSKKWETSKSLVPQPEIIKMNPKIKQAMLFFGTTAYAAEEAEDILEKEGILMNAMRLKSVPFNEDVDQFIKNHDQVFMIEQNKDGQMRSVLINELNVHPDKLISILNYDGAPITADAICTQISAKIAMTLVENK